MQNKNDSHDLRKEHWEMIYLKKTNKEMSWFQENPETSLRFLQNSSIPLDAAIIDIGGGDSLFVDFALKLGYTNLSVLDISEKALERAKSRLGAEASKITWIVADVTRFKPEKKYAFWHDRAVFHFLTDKNDIEKYINLVQNNLIENSVFAIGTFSEQGPDKCSGLPISKYSEITMTNLFSKGFQKIKCFEENHLTPSKVVQSFLFCTFKRMYA